MDRPIWGITSIEQLPHYVQWLLVASLETCRCRNRSVDFCKSTIKLQPKVLMWKDVARSWGWSNLLHCPKPQNVPKMYKWGKKGGMDCHALGIVKHSTNSLSCPMELEATITDRASMQSADMLAYSTLGLVHMLCHQLYCNPLCSWTNPSACWPAHYCKLSVRGVLAPSGVTLALATFLQKCSFPPLWGQ